ncbi:protein NIM1-INTERACTING 1-like [Fagus crenata]
MEGSASKKRKIFHDHEEEDDHDEEQKIEKFFALIKSIREARECLMINGLNAENKRKKKNVDEEEKHNNIAVWKPSFQREDFMEEAAAHQFKIPHAVTLVGSSYQREEGADDDQKGNTTKEGIDLRLSL